MKEKFRLSVQKKLFNLSGVKSNSVLQIKFKPSAHHLYCPESHADLWESALPRAKSTLDLMKSEITELCLWDAGETPRG